MSFAISLNTCSLTNVTEEIINPFTGETVSVPSGERATDEERASVEKLLADEGATSAGEEGDYNVVFKDGSLIELYLDEGFGTGGLGLHGFSASVSDFLYRLAHVGNLALTPVAEGSKTMVTTAQRADLVRERWPNTIVVDSGESLFAAMSDHVGS